MFNPFLSHILDLISTDLYLASYLRGMNFESNPIQYFLNNNLLPNNPSLNSIIASELDDFIIAHSTTPNIKLYYPEPFIATPTFNHDDIWFLHIVIYQYWLWFFFCFLIIFFFLSFLITIRWCNIRHRPSRETRGVSRSKCGDLITATVPVSWAASIIIHESTDAIEIADGFGTSEMAVGIRAYQWGWEYYYPKDLDLMFKKNFDTLRLGNSVNYWSDSGFKAGKSSFKLDLYNSDLVDSSRNHFTTYNNSLVNWPSSSKLSDFTYGPSRLISRLSNNLITSPKVYSLNNSLSSGCSSSCIVPLLNMYSNHFFTDTFSGNFKFKNSLLDATSTNSIYYHNHSFTNFKDLNRFNSSSLGKGNLSWGFTTQLNGNLVFKGFFTNIPTLTITKDFVNEVVKYSHTSKLYSTSFTLSKVINSETLWFYQFADLDFKRWAALELLDDLLSEELFNSDKLLSLFKDNKSPNMGCSYPSPLPMNGLLSNNKVSGFLINPEYFVTNTHTLPLTKQVRFYNLNTQYLFNNSKKLLSNLPRKDLTYSSIKSLIGFDLRDSYNLFKSPNPQTLNNFNLYFNLRTIRDVAKDFSLFSPSQNATLILNSSPQLPFLPLTEGALCFFKPLNPSINLNSFNSLEKVGTISTYYQSFWKVFKTTIHEERSHFNSTSLNSLKYQLPVISDSSLSVLGSLSKSTSSCLVNKVFKHSPLTSSKDTLNFDFIWSYFSHKFPFSVSFESDVIRYSWFDWYSLRSQRVTKAIDTSTFNLYGVKDFDYSFSSGSKVKLLNRVDSFFTKYSQARKLYTPLFTYKPYFYSKYNDWSSLTPISPLWSLCIESDFNLNRFELLNQVSGSVNTTITPSQGYLTLNYSFTALFNKVYPTSNSTKLNQTDYISSLTDVLSKKDYILNYINNSSPQTFLYKHVDSSKTTSFNNMITYLKSVTEFKVSRSSINSTSSLNNNNFDLRNPYQPMKKGVSHMIRIQADKAIAMPTDTRLQLLAVSKDIIHSWSIPSAGIKIDCIPGYSSHRICIFTLSGIYWGQCMEICGRFHHWMPIVVYFLRRDLFCIWCVHFIFVNKQFTSTLQTLDSVDPGVGFRVSIDASNWSYEL